MNFLHLNNLKKVTKNLNDLSYDERIFITHQAFQPLHSVGYGRNGASTLVDFQKNIIECKSILLTRPFNGNLDIYAYSDITAGQGARNQHLYIEFLNEDRKKDYVRFVDLHNIKKLLYSPKFESDISFINEDVAYQAEYDEEQSFYKEMLHLAQFRPEDFIKVLNENGKIQVTKHYIYTHNFRLSSLTVDGENKRFDFRYKDVSTYNSLPEMISIEVKEEIETKSLSDLKIEETGYYSHSDRFEILPEQVKEVKRFMKEFSNKKAS